MQQYILAIILILKCILCTFHEGDRIADSIKINDSVDDIRGLDTKVIYIKALPTENRFVLLFPWSNGCPHYTYTKNGIMQFASSQYSVGGSPILNHELMVEPDRVTMMYTLQGWSGFRQMDINTGNYVTLPQTVGTIYKNMQIVKLNSNKKFASCINDDSNPSDINIRCVEIDYDPVSINDSVGVVHSYTTQQQSIWDLAKIDTDKYIALTVSNGPEAPDLTNNGTLLYYMEFPDDISTWANTAMTVIPNTKNYKYPNIKVTSDGGWLVMAVDTDNDTIQCLKFDTSNNLQHHKQIQNSGKTVDYAIFEDVAYTIITSTSASTLNQLVGMEVNSLDCEVITTETVVSTSEILNHPSIDINTDNDLSVAGILFKAKTGASTYEAQYSEYLIKIGSSAPGCVDTRCQGCYGTYTCPMCVGTTPEDRENRRRGPDDCTCKDGFWDNFPTDIDCIKCNYRCATCSDDSGDCDSCPVGSNRISHPDCLCPSQRYYDDGVSSDCQDCPSNCLECLNGSHCNICDDGWWLNSSTNLCEQCQHPCTKCSSGALECTECVPGSNREDHNGNCVCIPGYYDNAGNCEICSDQCGTCSGTADSCVIPCDSSCTLCGTDGKCTHCNIGQIIGDNQLCQECDKKCFGCQGDRSTCMKCKGNNRNGLEQNCQCLDGYHDNMGQFEDCVQCVQNCKQCDLQGNCLKCLNPSLDPRTCKENNNDQYLSVIINPINQEGPGICNVKCEVCEGTSNNCTQCRDGKNRIQIMPCNCMNGFHDNLGKSPDCLKCNPACKTCAKEYTCTSCIESQNRELNEFENICECKKGYKEQRGSLECIICYDYQGECISECPPHTLKDDKGLICKNKSYQKDSNILLFWFACLLNLIITISAYILLYRNRKQKQVQKYRQPMQSSDL